MDARLAPAAIQLQHAALEDLHDAQYGQAGRQRQCDQQVDQAAEA